ncbi:MAG TPA: DUF1294 domain-containing protein [Candidatus Moranbacteria bacterium]|nr:DUF1294 domain-containing protein [Candidatus Moranbacteria bacterium]
MKKLSPKVRFLLLGTVLGGAFFAAAFVSGAGFLGAYLTAVNLMTLILYLYDKAVAGTRAPRVPEAILHLGALAGGSPAAWLAQRLFRHKTISPRFRVIFFSIVVAQILLFLLWWRLSGASLFGEFAQN